MTQVETEQDRVGRAFVEILAYCCLGNVTSEATVLLGTRYLLGTSADLTDLFYSIFLYVLP